MSTTFALRSLDDVLAEVSAQGVDPAPVIEYVDGVLTARKRRARLLAAAAGVLSVLAGVGVLTMLSGPEPTEIVADGDRSVQDGRAERSSTTTEPSGPGVAAETTITTAAPTTPLSRPAGGTLPRTGAGAAARPGGAGPAPSFAAPALPGAPSGTAPGTTAGGTPPAPSPVPPPSNRPPTGTVLVDPVSAGDVATLRLAWKDPDLPRGVPVTARVVAGPASLGTLAVPSTTGPCTGGICGEVEIRTRVIRSGEVKVELSAAGTTNVLRGNVTAADPLLPDGTVGQVAVVLSEAATPGDPIGAYTFMPSAINWRGTGPSSDLSSTGSHLPATTVVLPAGAIGTLQFSVDGACKGSGPVNLAASPTVTLSQPC